MPAAFVLSDAKLAKAVAPDGRDPFTLRNTASSLTVVFRTGMRRPIERRRADHAGPCDARADRFDLHAGTRGSSEPMSGFLYARAWHHEL